MKYIISSSVILAVVICSCRPSHSDTIYFDDIRTPRFSHEPIQLAGGDTLDIDCIGIHGIAARNNMLFLSTTDNSGALKVADANSLSVLGSFFRIGGGPGEFAAIPELAQYSIISDNDSSVTVAIPDFPRGVLRKLLLTATGDTLLSDITEVSLPQLKDFCISVKTIGDDKYLIENVNPEDWSIAYTYFNNGNSIPDEALDVINSGKVGNPEYLGAILSYPLLSRSRKAVAIVTSISQINVLSLDSTFTPFTIAPEGKPESYRQLIDTRWPLEETYYSCGQGYDDFFAVSRADKNAGTTQITVYGWDGNIAARYNLSGCFNEFDFDTVNNRLYTFDLADEAIVRYSLPATGSN